MSAETSYQVEIDGEHQIFNDDLLDRMIGKWRVRGKIAGQPIEQRCEADWILNHQFLRVHFIDLTARNRRDDTTETRQAEYEAMVFIGRDNMSERYLVHWIDTFGGRFSETLGYGHRQDQNAIRFVFEYPSGPLHNTFKWDSVDGTWSIVIEQKDAMGKWTLFANEILQKSQRLTALTHLP